MQAALHLGQQQGGKLFRTDRVFPSLSQRRLAQQFHQLLLEMLEKSLDTKSQAFVFADQRLAQQHPRYPRVSFRKGQQQIHPFTATDPGQGLLPQYLRHAGKHRLLGELDQGLEHLRLAGEMPVQSRLGHPGGTGQQGGGDATAGLPLQLPGQGFENFAFT